MKVIDKEKPTKLKPNQFVKGQIYKCIPHNDGYAAHYLLCVNECGVTNKWDDVKLYDLECNDFEPMPDYYAQAINVTNKARLVIE